MTRLITVAAFALLAAQAGAAAAVGTIGTISFSGHVLTRNSVPVPRVDGSVLGSITLSDGSDPDGPPATPSDFTGTVMFNDLYPDPGNASFEYGIAYAFGGSFDDMNPYHFAQVTLAKGRLVGFDLATDGDGDSFDLNYGSFDHILIDGSDDGGTWQLDRVDGASGTPEPATWALMITGFGFVGAATRRRRPAAARI